MKRLCVVLGILVGVSLLPKAASAGPVTVIDPIIGVRGGMFGSEPVDSGNNISFADCGDAGVLDSFSLCAIFNISDSVFNAGVTSITMHFVSSANPDAELVFENERVPVSSVRTHCPWRPGVFRRRSVAMSRCRLRGPTNVPHVRHRYGDDIAFGIKPIDDSRMSSPWDLTAQVTAVNGTPLNSVPEPTTLLLLGTGVATLAGGRLRRKNS